MTAAATPALPPADLDLLGVGNALVDTLARVDDAFLAARGLDKGTMRLIGPEPAVEIAAALPPDREEQGGGSAANTCAVAAALGARVGFLGTVADDDAGRAFAADLAAIGVRFPNPPVPAEGEARHTGRSIVLVTPDGQRTMNTHLGAAVSFGPEDVDEPSVRGAAITYLEGYLFDPPRAQAAFRHAADLARASGRKVAITLSDPFCVARHREAFLDFVSTRADVLFANEAEAVALTGAETFEAAVAEIGGMIGLAAVTRGARGSVVVADGTAHEVAAEPTRVVDTTGAGDAYAAGFLVALARGLDPAECGRWGSVAAAEAISHLGARPRADLRALVGPARPPAEVGAAAEAI